MYILLLTLWDHPRTCGENIMIVSMWSHYEGSPPHLRGKRLSYCSCVSSSGITPAPAGKTNQGTPVYIRLRDHPRTCGENVSFSASCYDCVGITPAPAGKTLYLYYLPFLRWDHPRTCGENSFISFVTSAFGGSPPHLRGKPPFSIDSSATPRITPAPAGKTD